jgi:hypothetical protein
MSKAGQFFKNAFQDMKESAKAQHEVDKAQFEAVKAESRAGWEEANARPETHKKAIQAARAVQIAEANARKAAAEEKIMEVKKR